MFFLCFAFLFSCVPKVRRGIKMANLQFSFGVIFQGTGFNSNAISLAEKFQCITMTHQYYTWTPSSYQEQSLWDWQRGLCSFHFFQKNTAFLRAWSTDLVNSVTSFLWVASRCFTILDLKSECFGVFLSFGASYFYEPYFVSGAFAGVLLACFF